jgi:hypothetical protein
MLPGDLVRCRWSSVLCEHAVVGIVLGTEYKPSARCCITTVLIDGEVYPFSRHQLEIINERT